MVYEIFLSIAMLVVVLVVSFHFKMLTKYDFIELVCKNKGHHVLSAEAKEKTSDISTDGFITKCQRCQFDLWVREDADDPDFYLTSSVRDGPW